MLFNLRHTILLLTFVCLTTAKAQFYTISGTVKNALNEPLAFVQVSLEDNASLRATTDVKGHYSIQVMDGAYVAIFTMQGFKTLKMPVIVSGKDAELNVMMEEFHTQMGGARVSSKKVDRSEEIIQKVIDNKYKFNRMEAYSVDAYIKATESAETTKKKNDTSKVSPSGGLNMAEVSLTVHFSPPDKIKEERNGVEVRGSKSGLFYLTHTDGNFNFYRNLLELPALSEMPILSPVSNSGLIAYKFKMIKTYEENNKTYHKIRVTPGMLGNALVSGELVIEDSVWCIHSLRLTIPKYHMVEYDVFEVSQQYENLDSHYVLKSQEFNYHAKFGKTVNSGRTVVYYSNYKFNQQFKKRFFNNELSSTTKEAYERDSSFWKTIRLEPYSAKEMAFIRRSDSMRAIVSQKHWQDSTDEVYNKITFKKLFLTGQGNYLRSKERNWFFKPLITTYTPFYIAGPRINYWVFYSREFKNKQFISVTPTVNFGTINKDLKGSLTVSRLYNPFKRGFYSVSAGSDFGVINPYNSWLKLFTRNNFYAHDYGSIWHRVELLNGLYLGNGAEYSNRRAIDDMKFDSRGDSLWGGNTDVVKFSLYKAFYGTISLSYVPFQKYIREPYQKLILGSSWPEFTVRYRKGLPVMGSVVDFDFLEFLIEQEVKVGLAGISKYRILSGEFLNIRDLRLVDQRFHRSAGPIFFTNPLYSFQGIDTSYSTIKRFYEGHYLHRFNGAILNKIPLLKKLNIIEVAGGGVLYTRDIVRQNTDPLVSVNKELLYVEAFFGFEKIIRLWKERLRIGLFLVVAESNQFNYPAQLKFTIETYSNTANKWPY